MPLVLDASVLVKLVVEEAGSEDALALLDRIDRRVIPDWALIEAAGALWNKVKYLRLAERHAEECLDNLARFVDEIIPTRELVSECLGMALRIRHPVYDALYLTLAVKLDGTVITADKALVRAAEQAGLGDRLELLG